MQTVTDGKYELITHDCENSVKNSWIRIQIRVTTKI